MWKCQRCGERRIYIGMGDNDDFSCRPCLTTDERAWLDELDERAVLAGIDPSGRDLRRPYWPYGPNLHATMRQRMLDWAARLDLEIAPRRWRRSFTGWPLWPLGGYRGQPRWADHVSRWRRDGRAVCLLSQPYGRRDLMVEYLDEMAATSGRPVVMHGGWYLPGSTWALEMWADREDAILSCAVHDGVMRLPSGSLEVVA